MPQGVLQEPRWSCVSFDCGWLCGCGCARRWLPVVVLCGVTVAAERVTVDQRLSEVQELLRSDPRAVLVDLHTEIL
jgi:hypothetical protein